MSDLISRKLAIELLENTIAITKKEERRRNYCVELIKDMPSAEPERKKGKWITEECLPGVAVCSICGHEIRGIGCQYTKYCDECGSRMDEND